MKKPHAVAGGSGVAVGGFAGYLLQNPEVGKNVLEWLKKDIGAVGFVVLLCLGGALTISVIANLLLWNRLKEKDIECQSQSEKDEERWQARFLELRQDGKEAFGVVNKLSLIVERLTERMGMKMGLNVREQAVAQLSPESRDSSNGS